MCFFTNNCQNTEAFIQPLDRKTKTKGKLSSMIRNIYKPTSRISTEVNPKQLIFATSALCIHHKALPGDRLVVLNAHDLFSFVLETLFMGYFPLSSRGQA